MISDDALRRIREINLLIEKSNKNDDKSNNHSFEAMGEHAEEIKGLFLKRNEHWAAETVDLLIHCLLLLERNDIEKEELCEMFYSRCTKFEEKISNQPKNR